MSPSPVPAVAAPSPVPAKVDPDATTTDEDCASYHSSSKCKSCGRIVEASVVAALYGLRATDGHTFLQCLSESEHVADACAEMEDPSRMSMVSLPGNGRV